MTSIRALLIYMHGIPVFVLYFNKSINITYNWPNSMKISLTIIHHTQIQENRRKKNIRHPVEFYHQIVRTIVCSLKTQILCHMIVFSQPIAKLPLKNEVAKQAAGMDLFGLYIEGQKMFEMKIFEVMICRNL